MQVVCLNENSAAVCLSTMNQENQTAIPLPAQGEFVGKMLSGSQRKTAYALRANAETLVRKCGLNSVGFLTLTVGDYHCTHHGQQVPGNQNFCPVCRARMKFRGLSDPAEASRRVNNLNRRFLPGLFSMAIIVTERHKTGAIHFHLIGGLLSGADIRTGLDFEAVRRRDYRTASPALRAVWETMRAALPGYGFGRHELLPIRKTGDAVAAYIAKYIEKNVCNRTAADKHKKMVRYMGWDKEQLKPNEFEWNGKRAEAWRMKTSQLFHLAGCELRDLEVNPPRHVQEACALAAGKIRPKMLDGSDIKRKFGPRWAFAGTGIWCEVFGDDQKPYLEMTPNRLLKCQDGLERAKKVYDDEVISKFRTLKWLAAEWFEHQPITEMEGKYAWWEMEREQRGGTPWADAREYQDYLNFCNN